MTYAILLSSHRLIKAFVVLAGMAVVLSLVAPCWSIHALLRPRAWLASVARRRGQAIAVAALLPLIIRGLMLPWFPPPKPQIHDDFSYLLQADTFAHGRLTNPTPPSPEHFESEYVLLKPTYASQYQPAQGLVLALGQIVFGHPWFGVWISMGLMLAALCWALYYIFPPQWALFGALAAGLQFGIFGLWMNSYFGGAVAAAAGALIVGSLVRMLTRGKVASSSALCAFGVIVLFASRPFEGLLWLAIFVTWVVWNRNYHRVALRSSTSPDVSARPDLLPMILPFLAVFVCGSAFLAAYNWKVTGNPAVPPYLEYRNTYGTPQPFWWQSPVRIANFRYADIRDNYLNQLRLYEQRHSLVAMLVAEQKRLSDFWKFFVGPFFTPALFFLWYVLRDRAIRPWLLISVPFIVSKATYHAWYPAQNAPETILIVIFLTQCFRYMYTFRRLRGSGRALSQNLFAACFLAIVLGGIGRATEPVLPHALRHWPPVWEALYPARTLRDDVTATLEQMPGKHLVFVELAPTHCFCEEWVANGADIFSQRVVYARFSDAKSDVELARSLHDHDVWVVEPDSHPYRLNRLADEDLSKMEEEYHPTPEEMSALGRK